jgi:hypothetical protein
LKVGVNLSGGDVGVAEDGLDGAKIGTAIQQGGSAGVPEHVRGKVPDMRRIRRSSPPNHEKDQDTDNNNHQDGAKPASL